MSEMEQVSHMPSNMLTNWYAVCVRHQNEQRVERVLQHQGWETLVPRYRSRRQWSDRVKEVDAALFSGFIFCRFAVGERMRVEDTPGVLRIVSFSGAPAAIDVREMEEIQAISNSRVALSPWLYLKEGDRVRVERGPLKGIEGTLLRTPGGARLVVGIELLQRAIACHLDPDMVVPVRQKRIENYA
jgi:transcription antitermination factor NusG